VDGSAPRWRHGRPLSSPPDPSGEGTRAPAPCSPQPDPCGYVRWVAALPRTVPLIALFRCVMRAVHDSRSLRVEPPPLRRQVGSDNRPSAVMIERTAAGAALQTGARENTALQLVRHDHCMLRRLLTIHRGDCTDQAGTARRCHACVGCLRHLNSKCSLMLTSRIRHALESDLCAPECLLRAVVIEIDAQASICTLALQVEPRNSILPRDQRSNRYLIMTNWLGVCTRTCLRPHTEIVAKSNIHGMIQRARSRHVQHGRARAQL